MYLSKRNTHSSLTTTAPVEIPLESVCYSQSNFTGGQKKAGLGGLIYFEPSRLADKSLKNLWLDTTKNPQWLQIELRYIVRFNSNKGSQDD